MSITDELREFARGCAGGMGGDALCHIADRIDAEHERLMAGRRRSCVFYDAERNYCKVHDEGDMAELGYVRLPVDTDGVPIRVGDVVEERSGHTFEVASLMAFGGSDNWLVLSDARNFSSFREPHDLRHHHEPTVEDVLREFFSRYVTTKPKDEDDAILAEYAAKLRLAKEDA